jgi:4-hydroxy-tetrahydrodipicolinate synthase
MAVTGLLPVIPTPFRDGSFDKDSLTRLIDHMLPHLHGYTLLGSTGEAPSLTIAERMQIAEFALSNTPKEASVIVGVSDTSVENSIALAKHAQEHGALGVLCSAPYYFPNSPSGILKYLTRLHEGLEIELVLYDNPVSTRTVLAAEDIIAWSRLLPRLNTVKLTDHNLAKVKVLQKAGMNVLAGDDPILARFLAEGVDGAILIAPAIFPVPFRRAWSLAAEGRMSESFEVLAAEVLPFVHAFGIGDEISTSKAILTDMGLFASLEVLPPLEPVTDERRRFIANAYRCCRGAIERLPLRQQEAAGAA